MLITEELKSTDKNPDNFKDWGCQFNCFNFPSYCKYSPVSRYACFKSHNSLI